MTNRDYRYELVDPEAEHPFESHGAYETLDEARGAALFDGLTSYEIWDLWNDMQVEVAPAVPE
jgi:hypothetical protein